MADLEAAIVEIVSTVCATALRLDVTLDEQRGHLSGGRNLIGCVQMTGAWVGAIIVSASPGFVNCAAKIVFKTPGEPLPEDQRDALGELSNMIAGNLKTLLPGPTYLALPTVVDGIDIGVFVLGCHALETVHLLAAGHPLTVSVMKRDSVRPYSTGRAAVSR